MWHDSTLFSIFAWRHGVRLSKVYYCALRKCANNKELDRSYTVQVGTQVYMVDRTLLELEQYWKCVDRMLIKLEFVIEAILLERNE